MMNYYKDFAYVQYILNMNFDEGWNFYLKCIERINVSMIWDLFLIEIQNGYDKSFNDYYKDKTNKVETDNMTKTEKETEEERIINKINKIDDKKFKKKKVI